MSRAIRKVSKSGIYHVMVRGVNKQRIFEQPADYETMYRIINYVQHYDSKKNVTDQPNFFLYAFCLMDNHIHLLIQPNLEELSVILKRITMTYAQYFNHTYERVGHLYQDRYKSTVVEDRDYFFTLLSYIHQNPVEAQRCSAPIQYPYTSLHEYVKTTKRGQTPIGSFSLPNLCAFPSICSQKEAKELETQYLQLGKNLDVPYMYLWVSPQEITQYVMGDAMDMEYQGILANLKAYTQENNSKICQYLRTKLNWLTADQQDRQIINTLYELTNTHSITQFQQLEKKTMRAALAIVKESGIPVNKIARLTGIPIGVIRYAKIKF